MPVRDIERELETLKALRTAADDTRTRALQKALRDKVNVIVAQAATLIAQLQEAPLIPDLCTAFERLLVNPVQTDPKCWGKEAIARALKDLGHADSGIFLRGAQHTQLEPVWGGEVDTAANVRSTCALALLQCTDLIRDEKLWSIMRLLTESSPSTRKDGALGMESLDGPEAALMLRIKARMGDEDPAVTGQMLESLLRVEGEAAVPFVKEFFRSPNQEVREETALALGASRIPVAVSALEQMLAERQAPVPSEIVIRGLGISRQENAARTLIEVVRTRGIREALAALEALTSYRDSSEIRNDLSAAVAARPEHEIRREFERLFQKS
jgi:HEAT repeat protein